MVTKGEFKVLVKGMKAVYTHPTFLPDTAAIQIWYDLLKDLDYKTLNCAIQTHMMTSSKQPTIADIRAAAIQFTPGEYELNAMEAWAIVRKAIGHSAYYENAQKEFYRLPRIVQSAVGNPANLQEWAKMDTKTVESVEQSHFIRSFNAAIIRNQQLQQIPSSLAKEIEADSYSQCKLEQKDDKKIYTDQVPQYVNSKLPSVEEIDELMKNLRRRLYDKGN